MGICEGTYLTVFPLAPEIPADLLWDLSILFGGLGLMYFLFVFFFRNRLAQKNKGIRSRKKEFGPMISNFLFYEDDASLQEKYDHVQLKLEIRELLKDDFNRKVLVEILLDLQKDLSGDARYRLFKLYKDLGLHLDAFEKLKSWRWEIISKGILELTQLQVEEAYGFIKKFVNHRRGVIRKQAQLATVSLKHEGIIYFLDTCKHQISEWQQLKLLDIIRSLEDFQPPRFKAWLTSKNKDVVLFSLRLIKYYKQNDANTSLVELVKHKNDQVKIEAINCIKEFVVLEALDTLKAVFWNCSVNVKLLVLDAVANLGKEEELPFLQMVETKENNFMVKSKALSAMNIISPESVMPTKDIVSIPAYDVNQEEAIAQMAREKQVLADITEEEPKSVSETAEQDEEDVILEQDSPEEIVLSASEDDVQQPEAVSELEQEAGTMAHEEVSVDIEHYLNEIQEDTNFELDMDEPNLNTEDAYWATVLDPEKEDETIFEICFMEELEDIMNEAGRPEESYAPHEILPINFLPIVEEYEEMDNERSNNVQDPVLEIEVDGEVVQEDEKFVIELNRILQRIRESGEEESEEIVLDFLPLVVDVEEAEEKETREDETEYLITELDVDYEVVDGSVPIIEDEDIAITLPWESSGYLLTEVTATGVLMNLEVIDAEEIATAQTQSKKEIGEDMLFELNPPPDDRVSIFNELFRTCDAESKLILLDEILAVGDERDLKFLHTLSTDVNSRVRKKAARIEKQLKNYLDSLAEEAKADKTSENQSERAEDTHKEPASEKTGIKEEDDPEPLEDCFLESDVYKTPNSSDVLEVAFELTLTADVPSESDNKAAGANPKKIGPQGNLLEELLSLPCKLIQKING